MGLPDQIEKSRLDPGRRCLGRPVRDVLRKARQTIVEAQKYRVHRPVQHRAVRPQPAQRRPRRDQRFAAPDRHDPTFRHERRQMPGVAAQMGGPVQG